MKQDKDLIPLIRNKSEITTEELFSVQYIPPSVIRELFANVNIKSEDELISDGYEPVCEQTRIMWRKK